MATDRRSSVQSQDLAQEILGRAELGKRIQEDRHVAVHTPLVSSCALCVGERGCKVEKAREAAALRTLDNLMQIDAIVETLQQVHRVRVDARDFERRRELQLEDPDAGAREARQALRGILELDRGVA